jgi:hypothetical protein
MRQLNSTEKWTLVLGGALILGGLYVALFPFEQDILYGADTKNQMHAVVEHVSENEERGIGVCAILMGAGIIGLALYQGKN